MNDEKHPLLSTAIEQLKPEHLLNEANKIKQQANANRITSAHLPDALTIKSATIPHEKKQQIITDLVKNYGTVGGIPPSLANIDLPETDKQNIAKQVWKHVETVGIDDDQALLLATKYANLKVANAYYTEAANQSKQSFRAALTMAIVAVAFFFLAIWIALLNGGLTTAIPALCTLGGAITALLSGVLFYLYGMTATQLSSFHARLDRMQRYCMAEVMCQLLGDEKASDETVKEKALAAVIANVASPSLAESPTYVNPLQPPSIPTTKTTNSAGK